MCSCEMCVCESEREESKKLFELASSINFNRCAILLENFYFNVYVKLFGMKALQVPMLSLTLALRSSRSTTVRSKLLKAHLVVLDPCCSA